MHLLSTARSAASLRPRPAAELTSAHARDVEPQRLPSVWEPLLTDGGMVDDFKLVTSATSVHVLNAPSPAATAALAIARRLSDQAEEAFQLPHARNAKR